MARYKRLGVLGSRERQGYQLGLNVECFVLGSFLPADSGERDAVQVLSSATFQPVMHPQGQTHVALMQEPKEKYMCCTLPYSQETQDSAPRGLMCRVFRHKGAAKH